MARKIPQRELRNNIASVLRQAQDGERFTITVNGRPVAELGPLPNARRPAAGARLAEILAETPVDETWAEDLRAMREEDRAAAREPWPN
jgi:prevent-host-death family protein